VELTSMAVTTMAREQKHVISQSEIQVLAAWGQDRLLLLEQGGIVLL